MTVRYVTVPTDVRDSARQALLLKPKDPPEITYRLASGLCTVTDVPALALWYLDHHEQFTAKQCTLAAALRGGRAGRGWALGSPEVFDDVDYERLLNDLVRSDQQLIPQLAAVIMAAWERQLDHATRKARSRMARSSEGRIIDFTGFPNRAAAVRAGIDDLMDKAWDAFKVTVTAILAAYTRTQTALVSASDSLAAESVRDQIHHRAEAAVLALVGFMDTRMREFLTDETPYIPQDYPAAHAIAAWVSGSLPAPTGFAFVDLAALSKLTVNHLSTAQTALTALAGYHLDRQMTWVHGFYGQPITPFPPHEEVDGRVYTVAEAALLDIYPLDHPNCRCELVPTWVAV